MVVRSEVDAFDLSTLSSTERLDITNNLKFSVPPKTSTKSSPLSPAGRTDLPLNILGGGNIVPQSALVGIKSQKIMAEKWADIYPQLYLSQTPWLYTVVHQEGLFHIVKKTQLGSAELDDTVERTKPRLQKLRIALQTIKDMVIESGVGGRLSFVLEDHELKVYERKSQASCLPDDILAHFQ
jgi:hypothetical protein